MSKNNRVKKSREQEKAIEERIITLANYIIETNGTVRSTAKKFGIGKSTVHADLVYRLPKLGDRELEKRVRAVLDKNISERAYRGGESTKKRAKERKQLSKWLEETTDRKR